MDTNELNELLGLEATPERVLAYNLLMGPIKNALVAATQLGVAVALNDAAIETAEADLTHSMSLITAGLQGALGLPLDFDKE